MYYVKNKLSRFTVLQFKVNLHSRTEPGLAYWCTDKQLLHSLLCCSVFAALFASIPPLSVCLSSIRPPSATAFLNVFESIRPCLLALKNNWPAQLALAAACHLIFGLSPSGQEFPQPCLFLSQPFCI